MTPDEPTQSSESTEEHRAQAGLSHGRRGFLRKAAAIGIFGTTGSAFVTEATGVATPTESTGGTERSDRSQPTEPTQRGRVTEASGPVRVTSTPGPGSTSGVTAAEAAYNQILLEGVADHSTYSLRTTGDVRADSTHDFNDTIVPAQGGGDGYLIFGEIHDYKPGSGVDENGYYDDYYFRGYIEIVITSGAVDYTVYDR